MIFKQIFIYFFFLLTSFSSVLAQGGPAPFWNDIKKFKSNDSINHPPENAILFIGSSSFTMWKGLQDSFPAYTVINRGFGGSTLTDLLYYENEIIFPYKPKQIVIYCGENDIASSDSVTGEIVLSRFRQLYKDIREEYPNVMISYVSMKPSPSRWFMRERLIRGNSLINRFLDDEPNSHFINIWDAMIGPDGNPKDDLFIKDMLHLNAKGYALWKQIIEPYLLK